MPIKNVEERLLGKIIIIYDRNNNILISHPSSSGVYLDETKNWDFS